MTLTGWFVLGLVVAVNVGLVWWAKRGDPDE